jgi:hypothetical protein
LGAAALSGAAAAALALALRNAAADTTSWAVTGFLAMALPAIASGAWLAHEHGRTGPRFLVALGTGWLLRAAFLAAVVVAALRRGSPAVSGALLGLGVGFVALTAFEMLWFARRSRGGALSTRRDA